MSSEISTLDLTNGTRALQRAFGKKGTNHHLEGAIGVGLLGHLLLHTAVCSAISACLPVILIGGIAGWVLTANQETAGKEVINESSVSE